MAKKDFKIDTNKFFSALDDQTDEAQETHETVEPRQPQETPKAQRTVGTQKTPKPAKKKEKALPPYRINLKLKAEYEEYLKERAWLKRMSVTQYISDLIEKDIQDTQAT